MASTTTIAPPVKPANFTFPELPPRFMGRELEYLTEALASNNLFYTRKGGYAEQLTARMCETVGSRFAAATSSGTSALHIAVGALSVEAGAEVITSPITDMGTLIAILYQNAIPVFAEVDPHTYNLTPESIEAVITPRTRAVIAVHLAGGPCEIGAIADLCKSRKIGLIEDCAQAWGTTYDGRPVGTFGNLGCFSLNHMKHLSCGDGGLVVTNDGRLAERCRNFADKFYDRAGRGVRLDELAPNYRMSELQAAVALAQLDRLPHVIGRRRALGEALTARLLAANLPGVIPHGVSSRGTCSYWFYMLRIDEQVTGIRCDAIVRALQSAGVPSKRGYLPRTIYREPVFQNKAFFPGGVWPAEVVAGQSYDYRSVACPIAEQVLATGIVLPMHEGMEMTHIDAYVDLIASAVPSKERA